MRKSSQKKTQKRTAIKWQNPADNPKAKVESSSTNLLHTSKRIQVSKVPNTRKTRVV